MTATLSVGCTRQSCLFMMSSVIFCILHAQDYTARSSDVTLEGSEGVVTRQGDRRRVGYVLLTSCWSSVIEHQCVLYMCAWFKNPRMEVNEGRGIGSSS